MRRPVLAAAAATTLLAIALPSSAEDPVEPVPTPACEPVEGAAVVGATAPETQEVAAPLVPNIVFHDANAEAGAGLPEPEQSVVELDYLVDASGGTPVDATRGVVGFTIGWDEPNGDYDVYVTDADGDLVGEGTSFNPTDGAGEVVGPLTVPHCTVLTVRIENYAGVPTAPITVDAKRTRVR